MHPYQVFKGRKVLRDLSQAMKYYLVEAGLPVAERFVKRVDESIDQLARMPAAGSYYTTDVVELQSLKQWSVKGFKKHVIYYRVNDALRQVTIVRILHGARDVDSILEVDD